MTEADLQRIGIKERTQRNLFIRRINNLQQFSFAASIPVCYIFYFIVPQYMNITTKFSTLKLLFFSFSSCLTIEQSTVFKTMDRQCESFSRSFRSTTGLDRSFIFIRSTRTSTSINENSEFFLKFQNFKIF
jgi:hypothetical protein